MATTDQYTSGFSLPDLMVPTQAATIFTAQENSLYLPGSLIPTVEVPAGSDSVKVAKLDAVAAQSITTEADPGVDLTPLKPGSSPVSMDLELIAARTVLRDIGGVNAADMGRVMGNAIASKVDTMVSTAMAGLTVDEYDLSTILDQFYRAVGMIREGTGAIDGSLGDNGPLKCVVSAAAYHEFMGAVAGSAFAGSETQNAAMKSGFIGVIAGVPCYVSSYLNDTNTSLTNTKFAVFSQDAMRLAVQGGVKLEAERRASAVGQDIVASTAFQVAVIDATRGVIVQNAV
jgi:hypothetical protein